MYLKNRHLRTIAVCLLINIFTNAAVSAEETPTPSVEDLINEPVAVMYVEQVEQDIQIEVAEPEPTIQVQIDECITGFDEALLETQTSNINTIVKQIYDDKLSAYSERDIMWLERVTMSEASTQSFEVQVAVAQTVLNRLHSGEFGGSIERIVKSRNQYSTFNNGKPNEQVSEAVREAISNPPYPSDMYYFRENHYHRWADDYEKIGVFYFSLEP